MRYFMEPKLIFRMIYNTDEQRRCKIDEQRILPCSTLLQGEYGEDDLYASILCTIGAEGVEKTWQIKLNEEEQEAFHKSCQLLKDYIDKKIKVRQNNS